MIREGRTVLCYKTSSVCRSTKTNTKTSVYQWENPYSVCTSLAWCVLCVVCCVCVCVCVYHHSHSTTHSPCNHTPQASPRPAWMRSRRRIRRRAAGVGLSAGRSRKPRWRPAQFPPGTDPDIRPRKKAWTSGRGRCRAAGGGNLSPARHDTETLWRWNTGRLTDDLNS